MQTTKTILQVKIPVVMEEITDKAVHLMVTSPPYFKAPFDYKGLFKNYD